MIEAASQPDPLPPGPLYSHLTPGRILIVLLAVDGFLFLSEHFRWFGFNQHKGWTVLTAVAAMAVGLALMGLWFVAALLFRLRFQFSLPSLLLLTVVVAVPCSWLAAEMQAAKAQQEAVAGIETANGWVTYDCRFDVANGWTPHSPLPPRLDGLRSLLGDDFFTAVVLVGVGPQKDTGTVLKHLQGLSELGALNLGQTRVTDAELKHLKALGQLRRLYLNDNRITAAGLEHLKGLSRLVVLDLYGTEITDPGLEHLKELKQLRLLDLCRTRITDAGLEHLTELNQLEELNLISTDVTAAGVAKLQQALPKCKIHH